MAKGIFSGLEDLGFDNIDNVDLYNKKSEDEEDVYGQESEIEKEKALLYDKKVTCPVCENTFKARTVKTSAYRIQKRDSDFFIRYSLVNPYFYDVWVCDKCGYSSIKSDFFKIRGYQIDAINEKIKPRWHSRTYPDVYDINIAIERYKLSLLSYYVINAKASQKAMNCLKLAWMYRILNDNNNESAFMKQALEGFNHAYSNEDFPIYGMHRYTFIYLIGEINRRLGNMDEALRWFSDVITSRGVSQKIKDKARDQKDLINAMLNPQEKDNIDNLDEENNLKKKGFLSKFFK